ncbi:MAG TPA: carboxypeptidase regulatory-like domain-containing protein [Aggregicoccus sp.]|nr:carboxypeptidase regulatory-like domain-containing protein [Aggregicoccus sp.]
MQQALAPAAPDTGLRLVATLLSAPEGAPVQARVGAAQVSAEDRAQWEEVRREGGQAPLSVLELANVAEWLEAPLFPAEDGATRVGPVPVSPAPRYRLVAWAQDGTAWEGDLVAPEGARGTLDFGALRPLRATGLRVELVGRGAEREGYRVRLSRAPRDEQDAARAAAALPRVRLLRPELAHALEGEAQLPLRDGSVYAPLPPDAALRLTLVAPTGREAQPLLVPLHEGRIEHLQLDVERLFPDGEGQRVALEGRVLLGTGALPPGARLEQLSPPGAELPLGPEGRFVLEGLPGWAPSRFALRLPPVRDARPLGPERWEFELHPQGAETKVRRTWNAPAYGWLALELDGHARTQLTADARRPYPVYLLERQDERGQWQVEPGDAFLEEASGLAVSLTRPGVYRVVAAASPFDLVASEPVVVERAEGEHRVRLAPRTAGAACRVVVRAGGRAVYGARVFASGRSGSLPALRGFTDAEGSFMLGTVRGPVQVQVESEGAPPRELDATEPCRAQGLVQVAL